MAWKIYANGKYLGETVSIDVDSIALPDTINVTTLPCSLSCSMEMEIPVNAPVIDAERMTFREPTEEECRERIRSYLDFNWHDWLKKTFTP